MQGGVTNRLIRCQHHTMVCLLTFFTSQAGIPISFNRFFKVGFPMMLVSTTVAMFYLLICHRWGKGLCSVFLFLGRAL